MMIINNNVFLFHRGSAAIWKSDQRPAWTSAACAAEMGLRAPRTFITGAKWALAVPCLAAEVRFVARVCMRYVCVY